MEICKIGTLALTMSLFFTAHVFADEAIPFHGKIEIGAIEGFADKVYGRLLSPIVPENLGAIHVKGDANAVRLNPGAFFSRAGTRQVRFQIGTCSGPSYKASRTNGFAAAEHLDLHAAMAYFTDWKRRAICEAEKTIQCDFAYDENDVDRLKISLVKNSCSGDLAKKLKSADSALEIYRVDGNNVAITDGSEHQPSAVPAQP